MLKERILKFVVVGIDCISVLLKTLQGAVDGACPMLSVLKSFSVGQALKNPTVSTLKTHPEALIVKSV
mgnify:CR=1 FL=1